MRRSPTQQVPPLVKRPLMLGWLRCIPHTPTADASVDLSLCFLPFFPYFSPRLRGCFSRNEENPHTHSPTPCFFATVVRPTSSASLANKFCSDTRGGGGTPRCRIPHVAKGSVVRPPGVCSSRRHYFLPLLSARRAREAVMATPPECPQGKAQPLRHQSVAGLLQWLPLIRTDGWDGASPTGADAIASRLLPSSLQLKQFNSVIFIYLFIYFAEVQLAGCRSPFCLSFNSRMSHSHSIERLRLMLVIQLIFKKS